MARKYVFRRPWRFWVRRTAPDRTIGTLTIPAPQYLTPDPAIATWTGLDGAIAAGAVNLTADPAIATWTGLAGTIAAGVVNLTADAAYATWTALAGDFSGGDPVSVGDWFLGLVRRRRRFRR